MNPSFRTVFALILGLMLAPIAHAETTNVSVTIDVVNSKLPVISVTYGNNSRQLTLADDAAIEIDGKKSDYRALLPGDKAVVTYDKVKSAVTKVVVQRDVIAPAEALAEGWQEIDQRLIFLMIRLANVEASLEAIERAIDADSRKKSGKANTARKADRDNEALDRKGGGPVKWSQFYGMTAEKFFYHPTDRNTTYHTETILSQQGSPADNKVGGGVPAGQGLPVHQRPPQFDYIYRANDSAKARAEMEASELVGKIDALNERRQRLEAEQAGLWVEIAFRAISHYDLDQKPAYRFEPLLNDLDADYVQRTEVMKSAASFMALALSIIGEAEKNQQGTFLKLKPAVAKGRQTLNDSYLRLAVDNTDSQSSVGRFVALAKRLNDVSANLTDSYSVATEGDLAGDQFRKDTFRALLQSSLINYAQIILAMDEMAELMKEECKFRPNVDKSIQFVGLANVELPELSKSIDERMRGNLSSLSFNENAAVSPEPTEENIASIQGIRDLLAIKLKSGERAGEGWVLSRDGMAFLPSSKYRRVELSPAAGEYKVELTAIKVGGPPNAQYCDFNIKLPIGGKQRIPFHLHQLADGSATIGPYYYKEKISDPSSVMVPLRTPLRDGARIKLTFLVRREGILILENNVKSVELKDFRVLRVEGGGDNVSLEASPGMVVKVTSLSIQSIE